MPHCGDVVTSDVSLTRDLTGCPGDGLVIGAPHVRIDLNHHRIVGSDAADTAAIRDEGFADLHVVGGALTHFDIGVDFEDADHLHVVSTRFRSAADFGILVVRSNGGSVVRCRLSGVGTAAVQLALADHYRIGRNRLTGNNDGVSLFQSSHNRIVRNVSSDSGAGIDLVHASNHNAIVGNTTDREGDTGVLLDDHADHNLIARNHARGSGFAGIAVGASVGNTVVDNHTNGNLGSGIAIVDAAPHTLVARNRADLNGAAPPGCVPECPLLDDGIHVDAPGTTLTANHADANADLGIDAATGVTDGGRNIARHNGDARECTQVICG